MYLKLIKLSEIRDITDINRQGEIELSLKKAQEIKERYDLQPIEILLEEPVDLDRYKQDQYRYGPFVDITYLFSHSKLIYELFRDNELLLT